MGTLVGHVAPGFAFMLLGFWHLFNNIKLHALNPKSYTSQPWFPSSKHKYLELYLIMAATTASISMELFIGPERHQPFDSDFTIPSNHLHNFEHALISFTFFIYAVFAIILDKIHIHTNLSLTQLLADHMGPEGQYHLLLQLIILISLVTTLMGISMQKSFLISFVRSVSILFQGLWLIAMGFMLWTPNLISKGCFMNDEEGHKVVRCSDHESLHRAVSLVNILFSWFVILVTVFAVTFYLVLNKFYGGNEVKYFSLGNEEEEEEEENEKSNDDVESQKGNIVGNHKSKSFVHVAKNFSPVDIER